MRRFVLQRTNDVSGASGVGVVAQGVEFDTGQVAMTWLTVVNSVVIFPNMRHLRAIHGHGGDTEVVFIDREAFAVMDDGGFRYHAPPDEVDEPQAS